MLANVKQLFALDGWLAGWSRCRLLEDRADCRSFHHRSEIRTALAAGRSIGCAIPDYGATSSMISGPGVRAAQPPWWNAAAGRGPRLPLATPDEWDSLSVRRQP
jgi:hypothetical protein